MSAAAVSLLARARNLGGEITLVDDRLRFRLPDTVDARELVEEARQRREELLTELRGSGAIDFPHWLRSECRFRDQHWSPLVDLHVDFIGWCGVKRDVDLEAFRSLLTGAGFYVEMAHRVEWLYGLVLAKYLPTDEAERSQPRPLDEHGRLVIPLWRGG